MPILEKPQVGMNIRIPVGNIRVFPPIRGCLAKVPAVLLPVPWVIDADVQMFSPIFIYEYVNIERLNNFPFNDIHRPGRREFVPGVHEILETVDLPFPRLLRTRS